MHVGDEKLTQPEQPDWDQRFTQEGYFCGVEPVGFLREHIGELPRGAALDLAMGEGRNSLFLAQQGYSVTGIEKSEKGATKAKARAKGAGVELAVIVADLERFKLPRERFDVVLCFYYLQGDLFPQMEAALRPGGALLVETYTVDQRRLGKGPRNPNHLLQPNELYRAFRHLRVTYYRETQSRGRAVASLLAYRL